MYIVVVENVGCGISLIETKNVLRKRGMLWSGVGGDPNVLTSEAESETSAKSKEIPELS